MRGQIRISTLAYREQFMGNYREVLLGANPQQRIQLLGD